MQGWVQGGFGSLGASIPGVHRKRLGVYLVNSLVKRLQETFVGHLLSILALLEESLASESCGPQAETRECIPQASLLLALGGSRGPLTRLRDASTTLEMRTTEGERWFFSEPVFLNAEASAFSWRWGWRVGKVAAHGRPAA